MFQITAAHVLQELSHHVGKTNGVHVRDLVARITGQADACEPLERKVRELVVELRMQGHHICAHPANGYFVAADAQELNETCIFLYERAMTSLAQIAQMKRVSMPDLRGQLHLPT